MNLPGMESETMNLLNSSFHTKAVVSSIFASRLQVVEEVAETVVNVERLACGGGISRGTHNT